MSLVGKPIGQTGYISSPVTLVENAPEYQRCRPRGGERRDLRGTIAPTAERVQMEEDYAAHRTARDAGTRAAARRAISAEEVTRRIATDAAARSAALGTSGTLAHIEVLEAALAAQQVVLDAQAAAIAELQAQRGNDAFLGGQS